MPSLDEQHDRDHAPEDVAAFAIGALDPAATALIARRLAGCAACRALAEEYGTVVETIPFGLTPVEPPPAARDRLLAAARARPPRANSPVVVPPTNRWRGRWQAVAAAAVVLVALGAAWIWDAQDLARSDRPATDPVAVVAALRDQPGVRRLPLAGSPAAPGSSAELLLAPSGATAGLVVDGLPPLPAGRSYQVWFVRPDQTRVSGGVFSVDAAGDATALVAVPAALDEFGRFGVTDEPAGGSPAPTGENVLGGTI